MKQKLSDQLVFQLLSEVMVLAMSLKGRGVLFHTAKAPILMVIVKFSHLVHWSEQAPTDPNFERKIEL